MFVPLSPYFNFKIMTTMNNNKRKDKDPLFAEVKLTGEEFKQSPNNFKKKQYLCRVKDK